MTPHWLPVAGKTSTPGVTVCFDTETVPETHNGREVLKLRCWDAVIRVRRPDAPELAHVSTVGGVASGELAAVLEAACEVEGEAWAFAHNAGFDLTVTSLPMVLTERGWEPVFVNLGDETCVFILKRPGRRLVITDTWSWLRCGLDAAAKDVGMRKVRLPADDDPLAQWHRRCRHDCEILDRLMSQLLDWWDAHELGRFAVTGSSCGWRTLRKRIPASTILVGPDPPRTAFEREAIYGGRKEVYRVGRIRGAWIDDWDLEAAHLTTVARLPLPMRPVPLRAFGRRPDALDPPDGLGAVCRVRVRSRVPVAPVRLDNEVWWPTGEFSTVVTTAELPAIAAQAEAVTVGTVQWYALSDALAPWAQWCQALLQGADPTTPRVVKRVAKGWGRSVPGRFALRTSELIGVREATHLGWALETGHDLDSGAPIERVTYAGTERTYRRDVDGRDISPVVLAFVEGYVRAAIARTIAALPPEQLLQVNTDGWWQLRGGRQAPDPAAAVPAPYAASKRATARDVTVRGPNHLDTQYERRLAGVPADARLNLDGSYSWQDWPGLRWQMMNSRPGEYARPGRAIMLQEHYCRRWVLADGDTVAPRARIDARGRTVLCAWSQTSGRRSGDQLAEYQVPALARLRRLPS